MLIQEVVQFRLEFFGKNAVGVLAHFHQGGLSKADSVGNVKTAPGVLDDRQCSPDPRGQVGNFKIDNLTSHPPCVAAGRRAGKRKSVLGMVSPREPFHLSHRIHAPHALDSVRYANILQGNYAGALDAAERNAPDADNNQSVIFNAQERVVHIWVVDKIFGKWDKLLTMEQTHTGTPYLDGMWSCVTGSALVATGDLAGFALEGEIKEARDNLDGAVQAYDQAVQTQDANNYTEPPDWSQSMRLYLGTALLSANRWEDAET